MSFENCAWIFASPNRFYRKQSLGAPGTSLQCALHYNRPNGQRLAELTVAENENRDKNRPICKLLPISEVEMFSWMLEYWKALVGPDRPYKQCTNRALVAYNFLRNIRTARLGSFPYVSTGKISENLTKYPDKNRRQWHPLFLSSTFHVGRKRRFTLYPLTALR